MDDVTIVVVGQENVALGEEADVDGIVAPGGRVTISVTIKRLGVVSPHEASSTAATAL
jgi:hypothetical protein